MGDQIFDEYPGRTVYDSEGSKIGTVKDLYLDGEGAEPNWATVTSGLFGTKQYFVPLQGMTTHEDGLMVPFTKDAIKAAPHIDADTVLEEKEEQRLFEHYNIGNQTDGYDASGTMIDNAMAGSGGELRDEQNGLGRARLHKFVVIEREQGEEAPEHEVVMHSEEPIVITEADEVEVSEQRQPVFGERREHSADESDGQAR